MELMEGETLKDRLVVGGALKAEQLLDYGVQIADALDAAHAHGIVHRDIKPANIFVTKRGQMKLMDFGLAKLDGGAPGSRAGSEAVRARDRGAPEILTSPGTAMGTVAYMSPEQARGEDARRAHGPLLLRRRALRDGDRAASPSRARPRPSSSTRS